MTLDNAFALWDWPTAFGLGLVGFFFGLIAVPLAWPRQPLLPAEPYPVGVAGFLMVLMFVVAFVFLIVFRFLTDTPQFATRTIGTGLELVVFACGAWGGLAVRS